MGANIYASVPALQRVFQIFALSQLRMDSKSKQVTINPYLVVYSCCVLIAFTVYNINGLFSSDAFIADVDTTTNVIVSIQLTVKRLAQLVTYLETLTQMQKEKLFFEHIATTDNSLRSLFSDGSTVVIRGRRKLLHSSLALLLLFVASQVLYFLTLVYGEDLAYVKSSIQHLVPTFVSCLKYYQMYVFIYLVRCQFEKLNECVQQITRQHLGSSSVERVEVVSKTKAIFTVGKKTHSLRKYENFRKLMRIRDVYDQIFESVEMINMTFGLSLLLNMISDFFSAVVDLYWTFWDIANAPEFDVPVVFSLIGDVICIVPNISNMVVIAIACQCTLRCANQLSLNIHRVLIDSTNSQHNTLIRMVSLQLLLKRIKFSLLRLYDINASILLQISAAIVTILMILVQFGGLIKDNTNNNNETATDSPEQLLL